MSVGVKGVYVVPDVVLDELERFSRGCVVTINNYKRTKDAPLIYAFKRR